MARQRRKLNKRERTFGWIGALIFTALVSVALVATHPFGGLGMMAVVYGGWVGALVAIWGFAIGARLGRLTDRSNLPPVTGWPVTARKVPKSDGREADPSGPPPSEGAGVSSGDGQPPVQSSVRRRAKKLVVLILIPAAILLVLGSLTLLGPRITVGPITTSWPPDNPCMYFVQFILSNEGRLGGYATVSISVGGSQATVQRYFVASGAQVTGSASLAWQTQPFSNCYQFPQVPRVVVTDITLF